MANNNNSRSQSQSNDEFVDNTIRLIKFFASVIAEIGKGMLEFRMPLFITVIATLAVRYALLSHWDYALFFEGKDIAVVYPRKQQLYDIYFNLMICLPALIWGGARVAMGRNEKEKVDTMFRASGVTNRIGQAPTHRSCF